MKVLLLGATGRLGRILLNDLLLKGYEVNALVRYPERVNSSHDSLVIFQGLPNDIHALERAIKDCTTVISALNVSRSSDFPWAKIRSPENLLSQTMNHVINLSSKYKIKRIISCSAWGVAETKKDIPGWFRWFIDNSNIGIAYRDHERQEELLKSSALDWTVVRPVGLTNSKKVKPVIVTENNNPKPNMMISRQEVSMFMVSQIESIHYIRKCVTISS